MEVTGTLRTDEGAQLLGSASYQEQTHVNVLARSFCHSEEGNAFRVRKREGDLQMAVQLYEEAFPPHKCISFVTAELPEAKAIREEHGEECFGRVESSAQ